MKTTTLEIINDHAIRQVMASSDRRHTPRGKAPRKPLRRRLQQEMCPRCGTLGIELFHEWRGCR